MSENVTACGTYSYHWILKGLHFLIGHFLKKNEKIQKLCAHRKTINSVAFALLLSDKKTQLSKLSCKWGEKKRMSEKLIAENDGRELKLLNFSTHKDSLPNSEKPYTGSCHDPDKPNPQPTPPFLRYQL